MTSARELIGLMRSVVIYHQPHRMRSWRKFYKHLGISGQVCFDVGAHVGTRAKSMRAAGAKVIAIEPQRLFASYLRKTLPKDVVLVQAALGEKASTGTLKTSSLHPTVSSMEPEVFADSSSLAGFQRVSWDGSQSVEVKTLDELIVDFGKPHYIKIDVEGFELMVLRGLSQPVELVSIEYLPALLGQTEKVLERLAELGKYRFNVVSGERAKFVWEEFRSEALLREWLSTLEPNAKSGDIFARLES